MREIRFYALPSGRRPAREFLDSLDPRLTKKVTWVMGLVEELDRVPVQYFKKLEGTGELWEIRAGVGRTTVRLIAFFDNGHVVVVAHGFLKKDQRVPLEDIEIAEQRRREHTRRRS